MKKTIMVSKSSVGQQFKKIKEEYYGKTITNRDYQAFILKNYFNVERMYVGDTLEDFKTGKSIYIVFKDGHEEVVSVSRLLK